MYFIELKITCMHAASSLQPEMTCRKNIFRSSNSNINNTLHCIFIGKPDPVDLTCVISLLYTIQCNWNTPYILPEFTISKYNINITNEEELVKQVSLTGTLDTQYTYNVSEFGTYTISITAVISEDLDGEKNKTSIIVETGIL